MKNMNYIVREDKRPKELSLESMKIFTYLKKEYEYIHQQLVKEKYNIYPETCNLFKELLYNDKVVGFVTYNIQNRTNHLLTNIYIIPGYRRKHIFYNEIKHRYSKGIRISIFEPTRQIIEILIKMGYAKKISKSIVISALNFGIKMITALSNNEISENKRKCIKTNIYDLDICASISLKILNRTDYRIYYTPIKQDDKRYDCLKKREEIDKKYFDDMVTTIMNKDLEIERWLFLLNHNLPSKEINVEKIVGTSSKLSEDLIENVESGVITSREAKIIQNQLLIELRTKKVTKEALQLRLDFLIENYHEKLIKVQNDESICPYCNQHVTTLENYCLNCGYTLYDIDRVDEKEFVYKRVFEEKRSYKFSLDEMSEKKTSLDVEYNARIAMCIVIDNINDGITGDIYGNVARKQGISHLNLRKMMVDEGLIDYSMDEEKWRIESQNLKKTELKDILKKHNCKTSGKKFDLIRRIKDEITLKDLESTIPTVTDKGFEFIEESKIFLFHCSYLSDYIFSQFRIFCYNYKNNNLIEATIAFLNKHIQKAHENQDHDQLISSLRIQAYLYLNNDNEDKFLWNEMTIFLLNLNMVYVDPNYYPYYQPIDKTTWDLFGQFNQMFTSDYVREVFEEVCNSFEKELLKISMIETRDYLVRIFKNYNRNDLNKKIKHRYYKTRNVIKHNNRKVISVLPGTTTLDSYFR